MEILILGKLHINRYKLIYIYIIWANSPEPWNHGFDREIIPKWPNNSG
jgi:hypothetical protein